MMSLQPEPAMHRRCLPAVCRFAVFLPICAAAHQLEGCTVVTQARPLGAAMQALAWAVVHDGCHRCGGAGFEAAVVCGCPWSVSLLWGPSY
jgi:hypothetical protein